MLSTWLLLAAQQAAYTIAIPDPAQPRVVMRLELSDLPPSERIALDMSHGIGFTQLEEPLLEGPLAAADETGNARPVTRLGPRCWEVAAAGARTLRIDYVVPQTHRELAQVIADRDQFEHPYLATDHGMLASGALMIVPDWPQCRYTVRFELPDGWPVLCPWPRQGEIFAPATRAALVHNLIAVGHWTTRSVDVGPFRGSIAFAPGQEEVVGPYLAHWGDILRTELELFDCVPVNDYLFLFGRPDTGGYGGSPKDASMTLTLEPRLAPFMGANLNHLIAHEFFHVWAQHRAPYADALRFVHEGFTDYFAWLVVARTGAMGWPDFAGALARAAAAAEACQGLSLSESGGPAFFAGGAAHDLVYQGGFLLAAWLDRRIAQLHPGRRLEHFLRRFNNDPRWSEGTRPQLEDFLQALAEDLPAEDLDWLRRTIGEPWQFDPVAEFRRLGLEVQRSEAPWRGDLRGNLRGGTTLLDLDPACPGARFGLQAGDRILEVNGTVVSDERSCRGALSAPAKERLRLRIQRGGEELALDEPWPRVVSWSFPVAAWQ